MERSQGTACFSTSRSFRFDLPLTLRSRVAMITGRGSSPSFSANSASFVVSGLEGLGSFVSPAFSASARSA